MRILSLLPCVAALCACASSPPAKNTPPQPPIAAFDGHQRLERDVIPTAYHLELSIDPARDTFHGRAVIEVVTSRPTQEIRLHAQGLGFWSAKATWADGSAPIRVLTGRNGGIVARLERPAPPGTLHLHFTYDAPYLDVPAGVFRVRSGQDAYVFTQFEALDARRAFPCFDQPDFKTPFRVTLRVPKGLVALANAPQAGETSEDGAKVVAFEPTQPVPTYLVAFAVGPFDVRPSPVRTELRVAGPRGTAPMMTMALQRTPQMLEALEAYFESPYPFQKLDLLAVPTLGGAMENVGLVTFADNILLVEESTASAMDRLRLDSVVAHELAHSWFGNAVTLTWWDDLWLNEAFATWLQARVHDQVAPEHEEQLRAHERTRAVMHADALPGARAIREPIHHGGDVENAFDGITYVKGAALVRMVEGWIGPEVMRRGLRDHVGKNMHGHATTAALFTALDETSGMAVSKVLDGFLNRPGLPWLTFRIERGEQHARVLIEQKRTGPEGPEAPKDEPWVVPVCVRFEREGATGRACAVVTNGATIELPVGAYPDWVMPNADALGYYRWDVPAEVWPALVADADQLTPAERASLPDQLGRSMVAETVDPAAYLRMLASLAKLEDRFVLQAVMAELYRLDNALVPNDARPQLEQLVRDLLGPHVRRLGYQRRMTDKVSDELLRPWLLQTYATLGGDASIEEHARRYADQLLSDPDSVDTSLAELWLPIAAWGGDRVLWDRLKGAVESARTPSLRTNYVIALGAFGDEALLRGSLGLVLSGELPASDFRTMSRGWSGRAEMLPVVWGWVKENHGRLVAVMGESASRGLPTMASGFCTEERARELESFFREGTWAPGVELHLRNTVQGIQRCAGLRKRLAERVGSALRER